MQHNEGRKEENAQDVETLIEALRDTDNRARQRQAAMALGQMEDARAVEPLIEALRDDNSGVRERAVLALGQIGDARAVEPLIELIRDKDAWVRRQVAVVLGQLGDVRAVQPLIEALKDNKGFALEQVVGALERIGDARAVEPLIELLRDKEREGRGLAIIALGQLGDTRAIEPLIEVLEEHDKRMSERAVEALTRLGWQPNASQSAWLAVAQRDWKKAISLGSVAVEPLLEALQDDDEEVRARAIAVLGKLGDARAVEPLMQKLKSEFGETRKQIVVALGKLGDARAIEPLIGALQGWNSEIRKQVAESLSQLGWQPANETQSAWLAIAQQDWEKAVSVGPAAVEPLLEVFGKKNDREVRIQAAGALGKLGDARAIKPLVGALRDWNWEMRQQAAEALKQLGWQPANETQSAWLAIAQQDWEKAVSVGPAAVEPLIEILHGGGGDISKLAARALEKLDDPRGADALYKYRHPSLDQTYATAPPPVFFDDEYSDLLEDPIPPKFSVRKVRTPPDFSMIRGSAPYIPPVRIDRISPALPMQETPSPLTLVFRKWWRLMLAFSILILLISIVATIVVKVTQTAYVSPTAGLWNIILFLSQIILLIIVVCFTPTCVSFFLRQSGRIVSLLTESIAYMVIFLGFAFWLFGTSALGSWLFYAAALVLLIEVGSHYIEWYKQNTLKRIRRAASYTSLEIDVKALEKMTKDEVVFYISVPVGLVLGTVIGLILRQTTVQILALCLQIVLLLASCVQLYFLIVGFRRMADPLFKTTPKFLPALTKPKQKGKRKPKASRVSQETVDQQYIDVASDVSGLRMVYKYDALHNTILLVVCMLIVIKMWLFPVGIQWVVASLLIATCVFSEVPYAIGQYLLHTRILEEYTGGKYVEMAKKLQEYAPLFPPKAFIGALLTTSAAGGILYALLSQMAQDAIATLLK